MTNGDTIAVTKTQRGYICEAIYCPATGRQFTNEQMLYTTGSRWALIALIKGFVGSRLALRREEKAGRAERIKNGWAP